MNRNRLLQFWSSVHFVVFLAAATGVALLAIKMLALGMVALFLPLSP